MSSLLNDGCCSGNTRSASGTKCKGCVCDLLSQLSNQNIGNICSTTMDQAFLLLPKGDSKPINANENGSSVPTEFTFVNFDPENCCATFTFTEGPSTRKFIVDCRSLAGIVCVPD